MPKYQAGEGGKERNLLLGCLVCLAGLKVPECSGGTARSKGAWGVAGRELETQEGNMHEGGARCMNVDLEREFLYQANKADEDSLWPHLKPSITGSQSAGPVAVSR